MAVQQKTQSQQAKAPTRCKFSLVRKAFDPHTGKDISDIIPMDNDINEYKRYKDAWKKNGYSIENYVEY